MIVSTNYSYFIFNGFTGGRNEPSFSTCPETHPYAYFDGQFCCKTSKSCAEENGTQLSTDSSCCESNAFVECPGNKCSSLSGEV